jgi:hypothetical protein
MLTDGLPCAAGQPTVVQWVVATLASLPEREGHSEMEGDVS